MKTMAFFLRTVVPCCFALLLASAMTISARAAEVTVDGIVVTPASPAPETLCQLKVRLKNTGSQAVSYLKFAVSIDGKEVLQYKSNSYAIRIDPGKVGEIDLFGFWSSAAPKAFDVRVTLEEAQWVKVAQEGSTSTTTPTGAVVGLPTLASLSVKMSAAK
jgi:hypothetical protein